jgi:VIT1/CCC1 family predicted Fe2+/Mn2+ transporter
MVPFALAAGLSVLPISSNYISVICLSASLLGGITMSIGAFLTARKYETLQHPVRVALAVGLCYLVGGIVAIAPFLLFPNSSNLLRLSAIATLPLLFMTGVIEHNIHGVNAWVGGIRLLVTGSIVAACAFAIAHLFLSA